MDSSVSDIPHQVHRRRLRIVSHRLKFLQSFGTKLGIWSFFPPANPGSVPDGRRRRRPSYERQRSLLDCVDPDEDDYSYEDASSSLSSPPPSGAPRISSSSTTTPAGAGLASDERFGSFIIKFHRHLVNEKKVSLDVGSSFAARSGAAASTPTPSTTQSCRTPISPDSYFNLEKQKAAGYICS